MTEPLPETTRFIPRWRLRDHVPSFVIVALGIVITLGAAWWSRGRALRAEKESLERRAGTIAQAMRVSLDLWLEVLHQLQTFFEASDDVTRDDFRDFAGPPLHRYPEIAALEWFPLVAARDRAAVEAKARGQGFPGYAFRELGPTGRMVPAAERAAYLAMVYMEPPNDVALGLDLFAEPLRRRPAERARDLGTAVVSPRIVLVEDPPDVYAVAIHKAVYRRGERIVTVDERRNAFAGVVVEILRIRPIIARALEGVDLAGLQVALLDLDGSGAERTMWRSGGDEDGADSLHWSMDFSFAERTWSLAFVAQPGRLFGSGLPGGILVVGLGASLLVGGVVSAVRTISRLRTAVIRARTIGAYTLIEKISEGGMGVVYKARHAMLRRPTALKILAPGRGGEAELRRFEREVQLTSRLTHPNTIVIFDYGRTPEATFYYAMEYLDGITIDELVKLHGPQPAGRVVRIMEQVCGALAEAHGIGLIHRDVKPANIMVCHRGGLPDVAKVLDFGLVKEMNVDTGVSESGTSYGTPLYLAPENISHPDKIDHRVDIYAVGLVMYYLVSGQRAVTGTAIAEVLHQHLDVTPERPSYWLGRPVPEALETLIMACLEKDPARRPQTAVELQRKLLELLDLPGWTDADAEVWWSARRAEKPRSVTRAEGEVTVDLARRGQSQG
ncbi:MAG TPA: CHASE domain-containing protein [Haliangiales bacterium]|nr:CHASE domain-containing protein [Haliangiales bacterium]